MQLDFSGKTVLVTGATRGIGAAIADAFADAGAKRLLLTGTRPDQIAELNRRYRDAGSVSREYIEADFSKREAVAAFTEQLAEYGRIDVCVNNAGINRINPIDRIETGDLDDILDINLRAPFLICRAVSRLMREAGYGRIINIASIWSVITKPGRSVYTATKTGLAGMTKTLAADLAPAGVLVNAVSPGFIMTELTASTLSEEEQAALAGEVPLGRFGQPEEIAKVVLFLASDCNTYITGQNIVADGGFVSV
jgi:3-oxoacyl-[acyl-carrier protein] reductase